MRVLVSVVVAVLFLAAVLYYFGTLETAPLSDEGQSDQIAATTDVDVPATQARDEGKDVVEELDGAASAEEAATSASTDEPPLSLVGRVSDGSGEAIGEAQIVLIVSSRWSSRFEGLQDRFDDPMSALPELYAEFRELASALPRATTDADGNYAFRALTPGLYEVVVLHDEYLPSRDGRAVVETEAREPARCDVTLQPGRRIAGRVVDQGGQPVADAVVSFDTTERAETRGIGKMMQLIVDLADGQFVTARSGRSAADGTFRSPALPPLMHELKVKTKGYALATVAKVPAGTDNVFIELSRGVTVVGRVVRPDGEPISGAKVGALPPSPNLRGNPAMMAMAEIDFLGEKRHSTESGEDGKFKIAGVAEGVYDFVIKAEGFPEATSRAFVEKGVHDLGDIEVPHAHSITGVVMGHDGFAVADARVWITAGTNSGTPFAQQLVVSESTTGEKGRFVLGELKDRKFTVRVEHAEHGEMSLEGVAAGEDITLRFEKSVPVTLLVIDAESEDPLRGVRFQLWGPGISSVSVRTSDDEGRVELVVPEPQAKDDETTAPHSFVANKPGYQPESGQLDLAATDAQEVRLQRSFVVAGTVTDANGQPVEGARLEFEIPGLPPTALRLQPGGPQPTFSDAEGDFELPLAGLSGFPVAPDVVGTHPVHGLGRTTLSQEAFQKVSRRARSMAMSPPVDVEIPPVQIELTPGVELSGRVTDDAGQPISGAQLRVFRHVESEDTEMQMIQAMMPKSAGRVGFSGADGQYRVRPLAAGTYRVEAVAIGYARQTIDTVEVDTGATLDVVLSGGGTIAGRVVDHEGEPFAGVVVLAMPRFASDDDSNFGRMRREMILGAIGVARTKSADDGSFELAHLPDTDLDVIARADGYEPAVAEDVELGASDLELVVSPLARIDGSVVDGVTGEPVLKFLLRVDSKEAGSGAPVNHGWRSHEGRSTFELVDLRAGQYQIAVTADDRAPNRLNLTLQPGQECVVQLALHRGHELTGRVVDGETGAPIEGVGVRARETSGDALNAESPLTRSDAEGRFTFGGLAAGEHYVSIHHSDYYVETPPGKLRATVGEEVTNIDISLRRGGRIAGDVSGAEAFDFETRGYMLEFTRILSREEKAALGPIAGSTTWIGRNGKYKSPALAPGRYAVVFTTRSWRSGDVSEPQHVGDVEVEANETTEFDVAPRR